MPARAYAPAVSYAFYTALASVVNSGLSRSVLLSGETGDLFHSEASDRYVPLVPWLCDRCAVPGVMVLVYELNGPVRLHPRPGTTATAEWDRLRRAWVGWKLGTPADTFTLEHLGNASQSKRRELIEAEFDRNVTEVVGRPSLALELLRQLTLCARSDIGRSALGGQRLLILIEAADLMMPAGELRSLNPADRHRVSVVRDWFADPGLMNGPDTVVLLAEDAAAVHDRVLTLPSLVPIRVGGPDLERRRHFLQWFDGRDNAALPGGQAGGGDGAPATQPGLAGEALAVATAGLSIHALRQLVVAARHSGTGVQAVNVTAKVAEHLEKQLGEGVVEFKKPKHGLSDIVGASNLKTFLADELIPRFRSTGPEALPGAAVAGPIGGGKTFIFEAVAAELGVPVLVLKNIRSQWFGQTDALFERLRGVLEALGKVLIFVDEADTQFGGVGADSHATERRLTGKIQQMMSDPALRGRVVWLLMTARIHLLSPDIRRPGRVGDLIIPVLDPEPGSDDRRDFIRWSTRDALGDPAVLEADEGALLARWDAELTPTSAAAFAALRSRLQAERIRRGAALTVEQVEAVVADQLPAAIGDVRRYQSLQALVNTTRRALLPDPETTE